MTWGSEKGRELPANWESEIVPAVKERDGYRCRWVLGSGKRCPRPGTDVDHMGPNHVHRLSNLRLLCAFHHNQRTSKQGAKARADRKAKKIRPGEEHPNH
jgi:hypothetical protein